MVGSALLPITMSRNNLFQYLETSITDPPSLIDRVLIHPHDAKNGWTFLKTTKSMCINTSLGDLNTIKLLLLGHLDIDHGVGPVENPTIEDQQR